MPLNLELKYVYILINEHLELTKLFNKNIYVVNYPSFQYTITNSPLPFRTSFYCHVYSEIIHISWFRSTILRGSKYKYTLCGISKVYSEAKVRITFVDLIKCDRDSNVNMTTITVASTNLDRSYSCTCKLY